MFPWKWMYCVHYLVKSVWVLHLLKIISIFLYFCASTLIFYIVFILYYTYKSKSQVFYSIIFIIKWISFMKFLALTAIFISLWNCDKKLLNTCPDDSLLEHKYCLNSIKFFCIYLYCRHFMPIWNDMLWIYT